MLHQTNQTLDDRESRQRHREKLERDNQEMNRGIGIESDRELIELAAKTVGIEGVWDQRMTGAGIARVGQSARVWNPLDYDEDLMKLIRTLSLNVDYADCSVYKRLLVPCYAVQEWWGGDSGDDAHAVLRAVVAIGKMLGRIEEER